jgi:hypothetical protein
MLAIVLAVVIRASVSACDTSLLLTGHHCMLLPFSCILLCAVPPPPPPPAPRITSATVIGSHDREFRQVSCLLVMVLPCCSSLDCRPMC